MLNGHTFFWLSGDRLSRLLSAGRHKCKPQTVLTVDTASLVAKWLEAIRLTPYNTGSVHVPNAPRRGVETFMEVLDYPYDEWVARRRGSGDEVVELAVRHSVPDVRDHVVRVDRWERGQPADTLFVR